ncbi:MAG TPA: heme-binding protein [Burkholderiales bacterium]|nr:heme-binding protein [Burkholderiales bacterium]
MKQAKWVAALGLLIASAASAQQALVTERTLSLEAAQQAAAAALDTCRKNGFNVTVTVLNKAGRTKVVLHDDKANPHTVENSFRKAYTAVTTRNPSGNLGKRLAGDPAAVGFLQLQNTTTLEGALPIMAGGDVVGSIGVSGAPGGDKDAVCAQAGIDRIKAGL